MAIINYLNQCIFDNGAISQLPNAIKTLGINTPIIVTDKGIRQAGILETVQKTLPLSVAVFDETKPNPNEAQIYDLIAAYRHNNCDGLIALGGGSAIDLAKAAALMLTHEGELAKYGMAQRGGKLIGNIAPIIAIPTTAGTGSEVSIGAIIVLETGAKETFISPKLIPPIAICDPELTYGLPPSLTAATGMDALTHCMEAVLSPTINPPAEAIGLDGIERIYAQEWLSIAVKEPTNKSARWNMLMASTEGALAFVKGLGACHALAHSCGRIKDVNPHHGTLNAIFLPLILEIIEARADEIVQTKLKRIKRAMGLGENDLISSAMHKLNQELNIAPNLKAIGLNESHASEVVEYSMKDLAHLSNSVPLNASDYLAVYMSAL